MASRGKGRSTGSLTREQLQALGIARGESNVTSIAPPPLFPKLETKPQPLNCDAATDYMLIVKDQFIELLHESGAYVKRKTKKDNIERYSDKYKLLTLDAKQGKVLDCVWTNIPTELRPQANRFRMSSRKRKLDDPSEISKRLQTLENIEAKEESEKDVESNKDKDGVKNENINEDEDLEEEQEQEYEVDDGTDYANNYFDNGENYEEDDDNLDDDPVY